MALRTSSRRGLRSGCPLFSQRRFVGNLHLQRQIQNDWEWQQRNGEIQEGKRKSTAEILEERGLMHQVAGGTKEQLKTLLDAKRVGAYVGIDPTAPSIHMGNLVPLMALWWLYFEGYSATTLIGGATAQVGDPTGRTTERTQLDNVDRKTNISSMQQQLLAMWTRVEALGRKHGFSKQREWRRSLLNNNVWLNKVPFHQVMKLMGSGLRMGSLMSRDSVKLRMTSQEGMSLGEFIYPILQAWDWWHMYEANGIQVQIGGADQFGNLTTGVEGVKHVAKTHPHQDVRVHDGQRNWEPMGFTVPLLTTSAGEKFGKSAGNAVFLGAEQTSPFDLYAYMLSTSDDDVERFLKMFTFLPLEKISEVVASHQANPEKRVAQHLLAQELLELAHGPEIAKDVAEQHTTRATQRSTISVKAVFEEARAELEESLAASKNPEIMSSSLNPRAPQATANNTRPETVELQADFLAISNFPAVLQAVGLVSSKSEGQRLIMNKGAYVAKYEDELSDVLNWRAITKTEIGVPLKWVVWAGADSEKGLLVLRVGKWKVKIVNVHRTKPSEKLRKSLDVLASHQSHKSLPP